MNFVGIPQALTRIARDELIYRVAKLSSGVAEGVHGEVAWRRVRSQRLQAGTREERGGCPIGLTAA